MGEAIDTSVLEHNGLAWSEAWLGTDPARYRPTLWRPAAAIEVAGLRQIWIWPLACHTRPGQSAAEVAARTAEALAASPHWQETVDLLDHIPAPDGADDEALLRHRADRYAEYVYFHDFVQAMLFRGKAGADAPIRLFRRKGIDGFDIDLGYSKGVRFSGSVPRLALYVFGSGASVLVAELDFGAAPQVTDGDERRPLSLADAETFIDHARRSYAPWYEPANSDGGRVLKAKRVPTRFAWTGPSAPAPTEADAGDTFRADEACIAAANGGRTAPLLAHWRAVLEPVVVAGYETVADKDPVWRQVVDERIPLMSFVSLSGAAKKAGVERAPVHAGHRSEDGAATLAAQADLQVVTRGDWIRLCFADEAGTDPTPYSPGFLKDFEADACYDRYWPSDATDSSTRFLFSGYHMAIVGAGWFFDNIMVAHFRRHYFQIGLVVNVELASMLALSSRISAAVEGRHRDDSSNRFRAAMVEIQRDFSELTHRYLFRGLSNQLQPTELLARWRKVLRLDDIYEDVKSEIQSSLQFLDAQEQVEQARRQLDLATSANGLAASANRLAVLATYGLVAGLSIGLMSMALLITPEHFAWLPGLLSAGKTSSFWGDLAIGCAVVGAVSLTVWYYVGSMIKPTSPAGGAAGDDGLATIRRQLCRVAIGSWAIAGALLLVGVASHFLS